MYQRATYKKRTNIRHPIYWHARDIGDDWRHVEARARNVMTWFFGDVFVEFSGRTRGERIMLQAWWPVLRLLVRLGPLNLNLRQKLKRLLGRHSRKFGGRPPTNPAH